MIISNMSRGQHLIPFWMEFTLAAFFIAFFAAVIVVYFR